jgi:hypothetical protein
MQKVSLIAPIAHLSGTDIFVNHTQTPLALFPLINLNYSHSYLFSSGKLRTLPMLVSAISCLAESNSFQTALRYFQDNTSAAIQDCNELVIREMASSGTVTPTSNPSSVIGWAPKQTSTSDASPPVFDLLGLPDQALRSLWLRMLGELVMLANRCFCPQLSPSPSHLTFFCPLFNIFSFFFFLFLFSGILAANMSASL